MSERNSVPEDSVESDKIVASGSASSQPSPDRRKLFRRLAALAGLGITSVILSQDRTGLLPIVHAGAGATVTTTTPTTANQVPVFDNTSGDVAGNSNLTWSSVGLSSTGTGEALAGIGGTGVAGTGNLFGVSGTTSSIAISGAIGVLGQAGSGTNSTIPIVAAGNGADQTENLQEWQNPINTPLSVVDPRGNFGVGTVSPGGVLDVEGSTATTFPSIVSHHHLTNSGALGIFQQWDVQFQDNSTANRVSAQLLRFTYVRNLGAGIPTVYDAMVNLTPLINDNLAGELRGFQVDGPTVASGKTLSTFKAINVSAPSGTVTNNYALITQPGSGNVGIGTNSPSHLIELSGGAYSDGSTWNNASSVRWKDNIEPLTDGVTALKQLHPVAYNYKRTPEKRTMGFIAEEIGKVLPTVVDWDKAEAGYAEGYDHVAILALAVQAVREQQTQINEQQSKIQQLEKLQERIAALEQKMH